MKESLKDRKNRHLEICLHENVETGCTELDSIRLPHCALPECSADTVDLSTSFLGYTLKMPVLISCMTGGSGRGRDLNRILARSAEKCGMAIGTGSIRVMMENPEYKNHFTLKEEAPNVPVLANIGAAQLTEYSHKRILDAVKQIGADGLYVHLNPAQELFQKGGDSDFRGWYKAVAALTEASDIPVLVKETGNGISPEEGLKLLKLGVHFIDAAGSGGTDWIAVENSLNPESSEQAAASSFYGWGYSTGELLLAYRYILEHSPENAALLHNRLIASGGLRTAMDFAVSLACGAYLAAAALPFIQAAEKGGEHAVCSYAASLENGIRRAMVLSGTAQLETFRSITLRVPPSLCRKARELADKALPGEIL